VKTRRAISLWKIIALCLCLENLASNSSFGQCSNISQSITYDTLVPGTGNNSTLFTFPQFDPSLGTLVSVRVNSIVSVNYGFTLKNVEGIQRNFSVSVGRYDQFSSTAMVSSYTNLLDVALGSFLLDPGNSVSQSSHTILNRYLESDSITSNVVNFLGNGIVNFNYKAITYTNLTGSNTYFYSAGADDTLRFSITYFYCNSIILSADITNFSAIKENKETARLLWTTVNEQRDCIYEVEKSLDGKNFYTAGYVSSTNENNNSSSYIFHYQTMANERTDIWFRLKIKDASGSVKYSEIRMVDMSKDLSGDIYLYPNPSDQFINIVFNQTSLKNWQVDILAANGALVQKNIFRNASTGHIDFQNRLSPGVYFARATDQQTLKNYVLSFIVR